MIETFADQKGFSPAQIGAFFYLGKTFLSNLQGTLADPDKEKHEQARLKAKANLQRIQRRREHESGERQDDDNGDQRGPRVEDLVLNEYENLVALEVVAPEDIAVGFNGKS